MKQIIEAEPLNEKKLIIKINGIAITSDDLKEENHAPWKKEINIQMNSQEREYLLVDTENIAVKFDGKTVKIQLTGKIF